MFPRHVLRTTFNRRASAILIILVTTVTMNRALALAAQMPATQVLVTDSLLMATVTAVGAFVLARWLAIASALMLGAQSGQRCRRTTRCEHSPSEPGSGSSDASSSRRVRRAGADGR